MDTNSTELTYCDGFILTIDCEEVENSYNVTSIYMCFSSCLSYLFAIFARRLVVVRDAFLFVFERNYLPIGIGNRQRLSLRFSIQNRTVIRNKQQLARRCAKVNADIKHLDLPILIPASAAQRRWSA